MSTKTTFKRLALVTVAALGLGVLTTAPSQAAHLFDSVSLTAVKSAIGSGETATATVGLSFVAGANNDSVTVNAVATTIPAGGNGALRFTAVTDSATGTTAGTTGSSSIATTVATANTNANTKYTLSFVQPTVVGTYVVTVYTSSSVGTTIKATPVTWTITVTAQNLVPDAANTTSWIAAGQNTPAVQDSASVSAIKTTGTRAATILVTQGNAAGTANETLTAVITGPGSLKNDATVTGSSATGARAVSVPKDTYIAVFSDGTTGTGTITITNSLGAVLGVETVSFYDNKPATVSASVKKAYILSGTNAVTNVFLVTVKDALGNEITADNVTAVTAAPTDTSTAQTVGGAATCAYATVLTVKGYWCEVAGLSATKFGKVNYTITATGTDAAKTAVKTTADVTFSFGVAKSITITGPASGTPLQAVEYTFTAKDENGLPIADQSYNNADGTKAIFGDATVVSGFTSIANSTYTDTITTVSGVATFKAVLPIAGTAKAVYTLAGTAGSLIADGAVDKSIVGTEITVTTVVPNDALEAANAATTAALAANDAVDALAATVAKLVANLKAQITALTKLIVKIQKKVGA